MQTFLPYPDFAASSAVLDDRRLGKQRVEAFQILRALTFVRYAWKNHPAVRMWRGFIPALVAYGLACCREWEQRGYVDTVATSLLVFTAGREPGVGELRDRGRLPPWLGLASFHVSHQSALVRKDPDHYRRFFPVVPADLPYLWPDDVFPRWPVRGCDGGCGVEQALEQLAYDEPRPGQALAVHELAAGRDVLLTMPRGHGNSATGLLAGLVIGGPTLWVSARHPRYGEADAAVQPAVPPGAGAGPAGAGRRSRGARAGRPTGSLARPPTREDLAVLAEEVTSPPDYLFFDPARLGGAAAAAHLSAVAPRLVVVDHADELGEQDCDEVADAVARLGSPPVLALAGPAGPDARATLAFRLRLDRLVLVGAVAEVPIPASPCSGRSG